MITVEDRLEIYDLYARQSQAVDESDGDAWARTFTEDGTFASPTYHLLARGYAELRDFAVSSNDAARARGEQFRHVVTGIVLTELADGGLHGRVYLMILATTSEGTRVDRSLVMEDELVRIDGAWRFRQRQTYRDPPTSVTR